MITYIITRFSIYDPSQMPPYASCNNDDTETYKTKLFDSNRLNYKFKSFKKVTLPSILNQTNQNYIWYIYSSIYLPETYKKKLLELTKDHDKIKCIFISSFKEFNKIDYSNSKYCTIRLDDDDGLSINFIKNLHKYKDKSNVIISHINGMNITLQGSKIIHGGKCKKKNNAHGLCAIDMNIHSCGNHTKVNEKYNVIYDKTPDMYFRNCSKFCHTKRKFK